MTYKLTRDDLKTLGNGIRNANSMSVEEHLDAFLADKKTNDWQVIASGEVKLIDIKIKPEKDAGIFIKMKNVEGYFKERIAIAIHSGMDVEIAVRVKQNS